MFDTILAILDIGAWAAVIGIGGALVLAATALPQLRLAPVLVRLALAVAGAGVAGFGVGHIHGAYGGAQAASELNHLKNELSAAKERNRELSEQALQRFIQMKDLENEVLGYEQELASGSSASCPSDGAYDSRLRRILGEGD